jgi:hypothetical protein
VLKDILNSAGVAKQDVAIIMQRIERLREMIVV